MGLLTDPKQRQRIVAIVSKYNQKLCVLLYVTGLAWFLALAYHPLNASVYFSENALLPGLVENQFYAAGDLQKYNDLLLAQHKKDEKKTPKDWILEQFRSLGLDVYTQNFTLRYPFGAMDKDVPGKNVYAILRARRSSSTESVVLTAPLRPLFAEYRHTSGGVAVMMALAKHFRSKPYIAKDIIFLMPEFEEVGMQAWLDAFHQTHSEYIFPGTLPGRSGQIQAAFNLEIPPDNTAYLNLKLEGLNGQQPNLDFVNLVVRLCHKEMVKVKLNNMDDYRYSPETLEGYIHSLKTMLTMMWHQAPGSPTGNHGLFHRYHIEALTLSGEPDPDSGSISLDKTGRIVEGVFRSLNNLLERFHQSFFFYILPSTGRYISIGLYMLPFALMVAAGLIKALALWIGAETSRKQGKASLTASSKKKNSKDSEEENDEDDGDKNKEADKKKIAKKINTNKKSDDDNEKPLDVSNETKLLENSDDENDGDFDDDDDADENAPQVVGLRSLVPVVSICMLLGFLGYSGPNLLSRFANPFRLRVQDSLLFGLLALFCASLLYPKMIKRKSLDKEKFVVDWQTLKSVALIILSLVMFCVALTNISLAFFLTATMMPVCTLVTPTKSRLLRWLQKLLLLLVSPAAFMIFGAVLQTVVAGKSHDYAQIATQSWSNVRQNLLLRLLDQSFFGSWTYTIMTMVVFPTWLMFWGVPHCHVP